MEELYSCEHVAERYGVKVTAVWEWIRTRKLPAVKVGRKYMVAHKDLMEFERTNYTIPDDSCQ